MKKFDFEEFKAQILFGIIICLFFGLLFFMNYIEEEYELGQYLWVFNIIILIATPLYYFIHSLREKNKSRKLENKTIIKNIDFDYYREIMHEHSPALLSFILDGTEPNKDLIASIIYLVNKGYLEFTAENNVQRTEKDERDLPEDLQFICNNIKEMLDTENTKTQTLKSGLEVRRSTALSIKWVEILEKQAKEKGLVTERTEYRLTSFLTIICLLEIPYTMILEDTLLGMFCGFIVFVLMLLKTGAHSENKWVKTQKGFDIYTKIIGLKNYLKDYSMISERELKEISIWEDYLVYAIMFNNTSNLNKEAMELYKKLTGKK